MQIVMYSIILSEALILIFEIPILPYIEKFNSKEQQLLKKELEKTYLCLLVSNKELFKMR